VTPKGQVELKTISLAVGLAANLMALGWFASAVTHRVWVLEQDMAESKGERRLMKDKLFQIDRIGDAVHRIESDVKELKVKMK
jgi:hypothetical protein